MNDVLIAIGGGLVVLAIGAELLVRGASKLARRFGVSELLIGLTIVGFGTSTPELVSSIQAALAGSPGIAVGNVVGSNIFNILLILGISAVLAPVHVARRGYFRDALVLFGSALAVISVSKTGVFSRETGFWFLLALGLYIIAAWAGEREAPEVVDAQEEARAARAAPAWLSIVFCVAGLALLVLGARSLVDGSVTLATRLGVSETVIGLTIVAAGTSLPELVTSLVAAMRGNTAIAYGNIVGSNIYNAFGILGVTAVVAPVPAPPDIFIDNMVMMGATLG
ncbi:MAG: calcium/sodium antiporter, partial [Parvularculaceae bacterium]|nr:calcium/sodium antiporter [Parvularculaceae bacterium]